MEIELTLKLGDAAVVKVRGEGQAEVIDMASFFQELPTACPVCSAAVHFTSRHPKGFDYYGMRCKGRPSHETTFGAHKEGGTLFYKSSEPWTAFTPGAWPAEVEEQQQPRGDSPRGRNLRPAAANAR